MSNSVYELPESRKVEAYLDDISYKVNVDYVPSDFALEFINFIKLVNGTAGEENSSPVIHYEMLDQVVHGGANVCNMCARGTAKTTLLGEYLFLYLAVYGKLPEFGKINLALYVSDSIENGVKNMRKNLEYRWENSEFLQRYVPYIRFTDIRWEFRNVEGFTFIVKGYGAKCLSLDSVIFTPTGTSNIGACKVGDQIYGPNGKLTTIILKSAVFSDKPMYQIELLDGRKIKVTHDHINSVVVNTDLNNYAYWEEQNLTTEELLKLPLHHHKGKSKKGLIAIKNCEALEYPHKDFPITPYVLGLLLGDGSIKKDGSTVLHAHKNDMEFYLKHIPYTLGSYYVDKRNPNVVSQSIKNIFKATKSLNICKHGDYKQIPKIYMTGSIQQRTDLLQGLMDTDGTIGKTGRMSFCSNSFELVHGVASLVRSLGGEARIHKQKGKAIKVEIKTTFNIYKLPRKADKFVQRIRTTNKVLICNIKSIPIENSQCIAVDNPEHEFLTTDYLRTHNTGVRGAKEQAVRPQLAVLDDLVSDEDARSQTVINSIEDTVYKAIDYALHPTHNKIIWSGTPFNSRDPLYKAVESGAWAVNVYPICEEFPTSREDFKGCWEDRFTYDYVLKQYTKAKKAGKLHTFNQELMLRIMSEEDRLIKDKDIVWYKRDRVLTNKSAFNFYITTDFATSENTSADYSIISVWAYSNTGNWLWVDGICKRQLMDKNIDDLFRLAQEYNPQSVGIEISGQQKGFIPWIQGEMLTRNIMFTLATDKNSNELGIRPNTNKMQRFNVVVPWFKLHQVWFPLEMKEDATMIECMGELSLVAVSGFRSKHEDFCDTISMLAVLQVWKPSQVTPNPGVDDYYWGDWETPPTSNELEQYLV